MMTRFRTSSRGLTGHNTRRGAKSRDESGAILLLALIFMVVTALVITSLAAWEGNDINNIGALKFGRSVLYSSEGAIQVATANTRYTFPVSSAGFCPNTSAQASTNPFTMDTVSVDVWCTTVFNPPTCPTGVGICSRQETLSAYPAAECTSTSCSGSWYVQAVVYFDDFSSSKVNDCSLAGAQSTCGSTMTVYSWIVQSSVTT
jgi:hypothetical protein